MLNEREAKFVELYVANGGNGSKAARDAGYSKAGARVQANRLLKREEVIEAIFRESMRACSLDGVMGQKILRDLAKSTKDESLLFKIGKELKDSAGYRVAEKHEFVMKDERTEDQIAHDLANQLGIPVEDVWEKLGVSSPSESLH